MRTLLISTTSYCGPPANSPRPRAFSCDYTSPAERIKIKVCRLNSTPALLWRRLLAG